MQQLPYEPGPVIETRLRVYINGIERLHTSASWAIESSGGLPANLVNAGAEVRSRTGSITFAPIQAVTSHQPLPVRRNDGWPPTAGDRVVIDAEVGGKTFRRFTGYLKTPSTDLTTGIITVPITDGLGDTLERIVSLPPLVFGNSYARSHFQVMRALEECGLGVLPPVNTNAIYHNGMQGGMWDSVGEKSDAGIGYGAGVGNYGLNSADMTLRITTRARRHPILTMMGRASNDSDTLRLQMTVSGVTHTLEYSPKSKEIRLSNSSEGLKKVDSYAGASANPLICFFINRGQVGVFTSPSTYTTAVTSTDSTATPSGGQVTRAAGTAIYEVPSLDYLAKMMAEATETPAKFASSTLEQVRLSACRGFENIKASEVINAWCESTLGFVHADEFGQVLVGTRDSLLRKNFSTSDVLSEKVFGGSFETNRDLTMRNIYIEGDTYNIQGNGSAAKVVVYQPDRATEIDKTQDNVEFISWADDVDVIGLDTDLKMIIDASDNIDNRAAYDDEIGSFTGICFSDPVVEGRMRWTGKGYEDISAWLETLGQRAVKITHRLAHFTDAWKYYTVSPTAGVDDIREPLRGQPMPVLRARYRVQWTKFMRQGRTQGPVWGQDFTLKSSHFLHPDDAQRIADALSAEMSQEQISFEKLPMLWDPRKQVSDVCALRIMEKVSGLPRFTWSAEYILTGYKESWKGNVPTWEGDLSVRKVTDHLAGKTYADLTAAYATYGEIPADKSYQQVYDSLPRRIF